MKNLCLFLFGLCAIPSYAQVGIGTTTPNASAQLDISSSINTSTESHTHTVTAQGTISNTGNGTAFSLLNPAIVLNYLIKY